MRLTKSQTQKTLIILQSKEQKKIETSFKLKSRQHLQLMKTIKQISYERQKLSPCEAFQMVCEMS